MKKMILIVGVLVCTRVAMAQTFDEWFRQKKTQIEYLVNQIAAYQVYTGFLEKGYRIAQEGLTTVHELKNGELNSHALFFNSLKRVNSSIAKSGDVADCLNYLSSILQMTKKLKNNKEFSPGERTYINSVVNGLEKTCTVSLEQFAGLLTDDQFVLRDAERLSEIDKILLALKDAYAFAQEFTSGAGLLLNQRKGNLEEINQSKIYFGLTK